MTDEPVALRTFDNEGEAQMAQQMLEDGGVRSFISKDDAGGMEPQLQLTGGVRLMVSSSNAERAREILSVLGSN